MRWARTVQLIAALTVLATPLAARGEGTGRVERVSVEGADPVDVAVAWSQHLFACTPEGGDDCPYGLLIARRDNFVDALASGVLRGGGPGAPQGQPLLLTDTAELSPAVRQEIERYQGDVIGVTILGGPQAVSEDVAEELRAMGLEVERIGAADRIDTAVEIARRAFPPNDRGVEVGFDALLARAYGTDQDPTAGFADTLAAGALSAGVLRPVLLSESQRLSEATEEYIRETLAEESPGRRIDDVVVVGGPAAVGEPVVARLEELGVRVRRVAGAERAETAVELTRVLSDAETAADAGALTLLEGYAETAWASGFAARGSVVLSGAASLPAATAAFLDTGDGATDLLCGPLVTDAACDAAAERLAASE